MKSTIYIQQISELKQKIIKYGFINDHEAPRNILNLRMIDSNLKLFDFFFTRVSEIQNSKRPIDIQTYSYKIFSMSYSQEINFSRYNPTDLSIFCYESLNLLESLDSEDWMLLFEINASVARILPVAAFYSIYQSAKLSTLKDKRILQCIEFIEKHSEAAYPNMIIDVMKSDLKDDITGPAFSLYEGLAKIIDKNDKTNISIQTWHQLGEFLCRCYLRKIETLKVNKQ
jgi:hypothetical protein